MAVFECSLLYFLINDELYYAVINKQGYIALLVGPR